MLNEINGGEVVAVDAAYKLKTGIDLKSISSLVKSEYTLDEFTEMNSVWVAYCEDTIKELNKLRVPNSQQWLVNVEDAGYASNLIWDLVEMTKNVPYKGKEVDMSLVAYNSLLVCPDSHLLAKFFI